MQTQLKQAQKVYEVEKFKKKAMPEVLQYLKDYKKEIGDKTAYNSDIIAYINTRETISEDMQDYLGTEVYLAQQDLRAEREADQESEMIAQGYIPLRDVGNFEGPCTIRGTKSISWMTKNIDMVGKMITADNSAPFFLPKGKRTRGYFLAGIDNGFYKPLIN